MKLSTLLFIALLLSTILNAQSKFGNTKITGKIIGEIPDFIKYTLPVKGICFAGFQDSIQPDSSGNFQINIKIDKACFIEVSDGFESYGTIIAEPEMNYTIYIDKEQKRSKFKIECKDEIGQALYNNLPNRSMSAGNFELEASKYLKDSISEINKKIDQQNSSEVLEFKKLLKDKLISADFYNLVQSDRNYFYKGVQGSIAFINFLQVADKQNNLTEKQYIELWSAVFQSNPVTNNELLISSWFYYYIENYLRYSEFIKNSVTINTISEIQKQGLIHTHNIKNAKNILSGSQLEYYIAAYIYFEARNKNYEKELISLFEEFKKEYPSSAYTKFVEPLINPIIEFHKKKEHPLDEKIIIIENSETINSLKEMTQGLSGKRFYIDVWATWCGPCKKEFKNSNKLYEALKSKGIALIYLSIDNEDRENQWRDMIHFYELKGNHIRANKKLIADLQSILGNQTMAIPIHILSDENGNITKKKFLDASQIENLQNGIILK